MMRGVSKNESLRPVVRNIAKSEADSDETVFFESFEGSDGTDVSWMPEGWTRESFGGEGLEAGQTWSIPHLSLRMNG